MSNPGDAVLLPLEGDTAARWCARHLAGRHNTSSDTPRCRSGSPGGQGEVYFTRPPQRQRPEGDVGASPACIAGFRANRCPQHTCTGLRVGSRVKRGEGPLGGMICLDSPALYVHCVRAYTYVCMYIHICVCIGACVCFLLVHKIFTYLKCLDGKKSQGS